MNHYPIDREKVEALKNSIQETEFWGNILARPAGNDFEIAYGHHRLFALQELGEKEVEIQVRKLSDSRMLQIMANENHDNWHSSPAVINETVAAAKEYLDGELARCESWERVNTFIKSLFESPESFTKTKQTGVGQTTILKFLEKKKPPARWRTAGVGAVQGPGVEGACFNRGWSSQALQPRKMRDLNRRGRVEVQSRNQKVDVIPSNKTRPINNAVLAEFRFHFPASAFAQLHAALRQPPPHPCLQCLF